ncbi:MAG: type I-U CRISPR-associated protein Cas7 [Planctomycetota bacterium]|nr:MAG: type I-U CRISPR-associated protein Cas7 [Planctomycetota bacterium]
MDYDVLKNAPRLLMEAKLKPLQGHRFQSTGFADLGPARYTVPQRRKGGADDDWENVEMLLVESAQSVANRMELACWDAVAQDLIAELRGLPYIKIVGPDDGHLSNSLLEAHRINSEYVMKEAQRVLMTNGTRNVAAKPFNEEFAAEIDYQKDGRVDWKKFHAGLLKYDPNSLVHGCFLEEIGGRLRATRTLSGFIEATGVAVAESGGVKNNIVQPELKGGEGNVPFHRTEFVARELRAYFNLDLALLRGYGLPAEATQLLIALSLFKIRRFLSTGLRLRTACDLEIAGDGLVATRPDDFKIPSEANLLTECTRLIKTCAEKRLFANPPITEVVWKPGKKRGGRGTKGEPGAADEGQNAGDTDANDEQGDDE